ncbi:hypothetical protein JOD29_000470 [Lysinibacillus composti]|uniref:Uncharacterized protein n=1 Tax=Lysinibacillus composti TaxID=720633 RepID=A0A3N9UJP5_9BACI|nr:hypothetical protein [Lysinibacillus composti]MBM7607233.1 hypothetical protein [Lysinibacillus composti]RQW76190.1 hypothetical protein EBB45_01165 [Lysinibacillus composti]
MAKTASDIKHDIIFDLLVNILKERGIISERELTERFNNTVNLSKNLDEVTKQQVLEDFKQHH